MGLLEKDKRKFTVIIDSKKCGSCCGAGPSLAAKKVKGKSGTFYLKETTKGSQKKLYGPYSSKKNVVQRGGTLREDICEVVLKILKHCDKEQGFEGEMKRLNDKYKILEKTYLFLGISREQNKCNSLKEILRLRNFYSSSNVRERTLCHCLCSIEYDYIFEMGFFVEHKRLIKPLFYFEKDRDYDNFYKNHWEKLVKFLRITIRQIELEILEKNKENSIKIKKIKNELRNQPNLNFNRMKAELEEARTLFAQGGPEKANSVNSNNNDDLNALKKLMNNRKLIENAGPGPAVNKGSLLMQTVGRPGKKTVTSNNNGLNALIKLMKNRQLTETATTTTDPSSVVNRDSSSLMQTVRRHRRTQNSGQVNKGFSLMKKVGRRGKKTVNLNIESADAEVRQLISQKNPNLNNDAGHAEFRHIMSQKNSNTSNLIARLKELEKD